MKVNIKIFLFIILITGSTFVLAQKQKVDSLLRLINTKTNDTTKLLIYAQISEICEFDDIPKYVDQAVDYADQLLKDPVNAKFRSSIIKYKAGSINNMGYYHAESGNFEKGITYYEKSIKLYEEIGLVNGKIDELENVFEAYLNEEKYDKALNCLSTHKELAFKLHDTDAIIRTYTKYAKIYKYTGNLEKCLEASLELEKFQRAFEVSSGLSTTLGNIAYLYQNLGQFDKALEYFNKDLSEIQIHPNARSLAAAFINLGHFHRRMGEVEVARNYYLKSLSSFKKAKNKSGIGNSLMWLSDISKQMGDIKSALDYSNEALIIYKEATDNEGVARSLIKTGEIYAQQKDRKNALSFFTQAIKIAEGGNFKPEKAQCLDNFGLLSFANNDSEKALKYINQALTVYESINDKSGIAIELRHLSRIYLSSDETEKALQHLNKSLEFWTKLQDHENISGVLHEIGEAYLQQKNYKLATTYGDRSLSLANKFSFPELKRDAAQLLFKSNQLLGNYKDAYVNYDLYLRMRDTIYNQENTNLTLQTKITHDFEEKKAKLKEEQLIKDEQTKAEKKQQLIILVSVSLSLIILLILAGIIYRSLKQNKLKNTIISEQKKLVEEKNKDITDSINYAKKIQEALLPAKEIKYQIFPNAFVLFQPRDIVSGDFYWFTSKNDKRIITAVDCTGHGVPGAFMSMIGNTFLNEIIQESGITEPATILSELRHMIIKSLKQDGENAESKDGMDMALLTFDDKNNTVEFAGANNPLWLIRNGQCIEYNGDKRPIGFYRGKGLPFTNHKIELQKGDTLYVFTDGFADQFGGPKGKKFKYKQFQDILISIQNEPMLKQEEILLQKFNTWKGTLEQVDDVLVIGVRI